jgi:predicted flap endonuclease-1-like 5' DNA nuclease
MANSILEKVNIEKATKNLRKTAKNLNKETMNVSEDIVEGAIEAGEKWTKVMAKAMKAGTTLFGKQQDLVLDVLEGVKAQSTTGTKRFGKLIGFKAISKRVQEVTNEAKAKVEETRQSMDEAYKKVVNIDITKTVSETVDKVTTTAKEKMDETRQTLDEVYAKSFKNVDVKTATKKVKKAKTNVGVAAKAIIKNDDLKVIEGVGPKMVTILNEAGIITFMQLATTKVTTLKEILAAAGPRYNMHNPSSWAKQAKLAAAGKMDELKNLKVELKAEKVVNK